MKVDHILKLLDNIDKQVSFVRDSLFQPEGVRILVLQLDDFGLVESWDRDLPPRLFGVAAEKVEDKILIQWMFDAMGAIPLTTLAAEINIEILSHLKYSELPKNVTKAMDVMLIKYIELGEQDKYKNLLEQTRKRYDFINNLSRGRQIQRDNRQDLPESSS